LKHKHYLLVLKKACLYYEPDDPDFIRVTHRVYEHINETREYELLHSTRFFGPLVFYLAWYDKPDNLLTHLQSLSPQRDNDIIQILKLYEIIHGKEKSIKYKELNDKVQSKTANEPNKSLKDDTPK
jgi:small subunit ribosomal protein S22